MTLVLGAWLEWKTRVLTLVQGEGLDRARIGAVREGEGSDGGHDNLSISMSGHASRGLDGDRQVGPGSGRSPAAPEATGTRSVSAGPGRRVFLGARGGRRPGKKVAPPGCVSGRRTDQIKPKEVRAWRVKPQESEIQTPTPSAGTEPAPAHPTRPLRARLSPHEEAAEQRPPLMQSSGGGAVRLPGIHMLSQSRPSEYLCRRPN